MASKMKRAHVIVKGRVQGVSYRLWTFRQAQSLGLTGWVRNIGKADVEAVFEGPVDKIKQMIKSCHQDPPHAKVEKIDVLWEKATGEFRAFKII